MRETISETTITTVKATVPALKEHGTSIIMKFYETLFERYPALKSYFNMDRQKGGSTAEKGVPLQVLSLMRAVLAFAQNIDNIEVILPVVERICHKHVSRGVLPVHYDAVGECLLSAIKDVLEEAATDDIMNAWTEAFQFLANIFINIENKLKSELARKAGFEGIVDMRVTSIDVNENNTHTIGLIPTSHPVPPYENGQHVAIAIVLEDKSETMTTMKLIQTEKDQLTISVPNSKEKATIGLRNSKINDILKVSMPCGKTRA